MALTVDQQYLKDVESFLSTNIPPKLESILTDNNYKDWKFKLDAKLFYYKLNRFTETFEESTYKMDSFRRLDKITTNFILEHIQSDLRDKFVDSSTTKDLITKLEAHFRGNTQVQSIKVFSKIHDIMINKPDDLDILIQTIKSTMRDFKMLYDNNINELWKCIFLYCLSPSHHNLRSILLANDKLQIDDYFKNAQREQTLSSTSIKINLNSNINKSNQPHHYNHFKSKDLKCFECNAKHPLKDCPIFKNKVKRDKDYLPKALIEFRSRMRERNRKRNVSFLRTNVSDHTDNDECDSNMPVVNCSLVSNLNLNKSNKYYLDSGATDHFLNSSDDIIGLKNSNTQIYTASGDRFDIAGIGTRELITSTNCKLRIQDAIICNSLYANFISVPKLDQKGFRVEFNSGRSSIYHDDLLVMIAELNSDNGLYEIKTKQQSINSVNSDSDVILSWHQLLGHVNLNDLKVLSKKLNINIPSNYQLSCETCNMCKLKRLPFKSSITKSATRPGEKFHLDISGKIRITNREKYQYFFLIIDEFSRFTYLYLLKSKSDVYVCIKQFIPLIRNKFNLPIICLHSDNGTEFRNTHIDTLCDEHGIVQSFTTPNCPQENGAVERSNGTIESISRSLLFHVGISVSFWPFAIRYAVHVKNRIPHSGIAGKIPFEVYENKQVDYSKFQLFGSKIYYLLNEEERQSKFDKVAEIGIHLGKADQSSGYYIYSTKSHKIITRRHVKFTRENYLDSSEDDIQLMNNNLFDYIDDRFQSQSNLDVEDREFYAFRARNQHNHQSENNQSLSVESNQLQVQQSTNVNDLSDLPFFNENISNASDSSNNQPADQLSINSNNYTPISDISELNDHLFNRLRRGEVVELNRDQRDLISQNHPDLNWQFVAPVNRANQKGIARYRVNSIVLPRYFHEIKNFSDSDL